MDAFWAACHHTPETNHAGYHWHRCSLDQLPPAVLDSVAAAVQTHYLTPAPFRTTTGGAALADSLSARLPNLAGTTNARIDRGGDLGEMLAIEWLKLGRIGTWDVCYSLRWKESPRPRRGEDIIALRWGDTPVGILKGEAKAGEAISNDTLADARNRLNQDNGWPSQFTIEFVCERLSFENRHAEAKRLYDERFVVRRAPGQTGCAHLLFLLSPADPTERLPAAAPAPLPCSQTQFGAYFHCATYVQLRDSLFQRAIQLSGA